MDGNELLVETLANLDPNDTDGNADLYVVHNPFTAAATFTRIGVGLTNDVDACRGARLTSLAGSPVVLVATAERLDPADIDGSDDVYRFDARTAVAPTQVNLEPRSCTALPPLGTSTRLNVAGERYLLEFDSEDGAGGGLRGIIGTFADCP